MVWTVVNGRSTMTSTWDICEEEMRVTKTPISRDLLVVLRVVFLPEEKDQGLKLRTRVLCRRSSHTLWVTTNGRPLNVTVGTPTERRTVGTGQSTPGRNRTSWSHLERCTRCRGGRDSRLRVCTQPPKRVHGTKEPTRRTRDLHH